ncbi:GNAT family N-acetyltransferase [Paracraurococcus ruber]|uniref:N-acetyltransferase domain-containing protein n=1 Tax=Paracraurococcus ruber TaxID=77675 RepID=A0ABS1D0Q7_9PROT|nr:GNAT family N-acetyltransferase [Paracraurococcus ruber]MBK1660136.1 hypothetical protein [Paracraurococcus ruber]TDG28691.1 GNAT family N-acetyltransferase [Paracraurococcus ruber]
MDLPPGLILSLEESPPEADLDVLADGLEAFNEAAWPGHLPWQAFALMLREDGRIRGGIAGESYCGWLFIRFFWLEEALRRGGLGAGLIDAAEAEARRRGCHSAYVDTFNFQAPEFYRSQGYAEFARLPYPPRGERIWLRKRLTEDAP